MTRPWVPLDATAWPAIAEALSAGQGPWPAEAVAFDLRWWARSMPPGRPAKPATTFSAGLPLLSGRRNRDKEHPPQRLAMTATPQGAAGDLTLGGPPGPTPRVTALLLSKNKNSTNDISTHQHCTRRFF